MQRDYIISHSLCKNFDKGSLSVSRIYCAKTLCNSKTEDVEVQCQKKKKTDQSKNE
ncbi:17836_t:CDS:2 [Racocetra fulgida]|uniref:17836_t:CDS:1 n=1 Tax=Racocetra fulgida TaxID=60492 RepID=A0A9N8WNP4_9GLOM|nr:17836_t:CDS:2 [Racocetra fulgida]